MRRVGILGFGVEGQSVLRALQRWGGNSPVVLTDAPDSRTTVPCDLPWYTGEDALRALAKLDLLIRSPGFPPQHPIICSARRQGMALTSASNLFLQMARAKNATVIGVTGSKGKSTTATLVYRLLLAAGRNAVLVGNIGKPSLDALDRVLSEKPITVLELSSYQCHDLKLGPTDALVLSLFPEHMDWHGSVEAYYRDKLQIAAVQRPGDRIYYNAGEAELRHRVPLGPGQHFAYNLVQGLHFRRGWFRDYRQRLARDEGMQLAGLHNRINALGAYAVTRAFGVEPRHLSSVLSQFTGLPHRLESLGVYGGINWVNDSISTAPQSICAALQSFSDVDTLIAGGADRGYDYTPAVIVMHSQGLSNVILLPPGGEFIAKAIRSIDGGDAEIKVYEVNDMAEAVSCAARVTRPGRVCLLSPGAPSHGIYRGFEQRGEHYRSLVERLQEVE